MPHCRIQPLSRGHYSRPSLPLICKLSAVAMLVACQQRGVVEPVVCYCVLVTYPVWGRGTAFPPLLLPCPFTSSSFALYYLFPFSFSHPLYLFSFIVHPIPFYQNSPTLFPGVRSQEATEPGFSLFCFMIVLSVLLS